MKKRVLPIALLLALGLVACGPTAPTTSEKPTEPDVPATSEPAPSEDQTTTEEVPPAVTKIEITNKADLQKEWHEKDDADVSRTLAIKTDVPINLTQALKNGDIVISSSDDKVVQASGKFIIAVAKGTATITVTYKETIKDSVDITILEEKVAPVIGIKALREGIKDGTYKKDSIVDFYGKVVATVEPTTDPDKGELHNGIWLADGDYAMMVYAGNAKESWAAEGMKMGDTVYCKGKLAPYNGLNEVKPTEFRKMTADDKYTVAEPTVLDVTADNFSAEGLDGQDGRRFNAKDLIYVDGAIENVGARATLNFKWVKADKTEVKVPLSVNYHIGKEAMTALKAKTDTLAAGNKVDLTGVISWFNAPQLELQFIEGKTPADCITIEAQPDPTKLTITGKNTVRATEFIDLKVTAEPAGASPAVTWKVDNEKIATIDGNGRLTGVAEGEVTVTATSKEVPTLTTTFKVTVTKAPVTNGPAVAETFEVGVPYKLGVNLQKTGKTGFLSNEVKDFKLQPAESYDAASDIVVTKVTDGYKLTLGGKDLGIERTPSDKAGQYKNAVCIGKADAELIKTTWLYDETLNTFHVSFKDTDYDDIYLGNRDTNTTFEVGSTPRKFAKTNNLVHLYDYVVNPEIYEGDAIVGEHALGLFQKGLGHYLFWDGKVNDRGYLTTVDYVDEAAKVTFAKVGNQYTIKVGDKYLNINSYYNEGVKGKFELTTTESKFDYDAERNMFTVTRTHANKDGVDKTDTLGITAYGTYNTFSVSQSWSFDKDTTYLATAMDNTVKYPGAKGIVISGTNEVTVGKTVKLSANVYPTGAKQTVTWSVNDEKIATIDANGTVTGVAAGDVVVTAKSTVTATVVGTYTVTVKAAPIGADSATFNKANCFATLTSPDTEDLNGVTKTVGKISAKFEKNTSRNTPIAHSDGTFRVYQNGSVTITCAEDVKITTITMNITKNGKVDIFTIENGTAVYDGGTLTITVTDPTAPVKLTVTGNTQVRFDSMIVDHLAR